MRPIAKPNSTCRPPKPMPSINICRLSGTSNASRPSATKQPPMAPIVRVVGTLALIKAQPYSSSQVPGIACQLPYDQCTAVMTAPANKEGIKQQANLRIGVPESARFRSEEGLITSEPPRPPAIPAATSQIENQCRCRFGAQANPAATRPTAPIAIPADPGTANEVAASIELRM